MIYIYMNYNKANFMILSAHTYLYILLYFTDCKHLNKTQYECNSTQCYMIIYKYKYIYIYTLLANIWKEPFPRLAYRYILMSNVRRKLILICVNILRSRQNGRDFPDDIFIWIFVNENIRILIEISLTIVPMGLFNIILALIQIMA